ncbi:D-beta-hydroxybutyrate dehydrogenase, mitochondrial-like [Periplaneta americana]|uniref:D-beta-hydroxybutyrate dehydrogenase, mitochondrial-like n=1 Tax=Periplaneta americana TaxID=6978 RepID=UPI0037E9AA1C
MDLSLDGIYRTSVRGLQVGLGSALTLVIVKTIVTLPGLEPVSPLAAFLTFTMLGTALALYSDTLKISLHGKSVLITGCDSGFGHDLALRLEKMGAVVFAGCLKPDEGGAKELKDMNLKKLHVIKMDVTSDEDIASGVDYVSRHAPPQGLWGIVNNAGLSTFGYVEWVPISTCKKIMDVNVWGTIRVIRAFLPFIRESKGRVVNMSSGLSRFSFPNRSTYGLSKYAIQSLSDCLRYEMRSWKVNVSVIEPGNFVNATGIFTADAIRKEAANLWNQIPEPVQKAYTKEFYDRIISNMIKYCTVGTTSKKLVLDAYTLALVHRYPHPRYQPMEPDMKIKAWVNTHLPEWVFETFFV